MSVGAMTPVPACVPCMLPCEANLMARLNGCMLKVSKMLSFAGIKVTDI